MTHHGGIVCTSWANWYRKQALTVQHGIGDRGFRSRLTGEAVAGPANLTDDELAENRSDLEREILDHPWDDDYHRERSPDGAGA